MRHNIKTEKLKSQYRYENHAEKYFTNKKKMKTKMHPNCFFYYLYTTNSFKSFF